MNPSNIPYKEKQINIGVIGAGNHSRSQHGPALKAYKDKNPNKIRLSAVCDLDISKAKYYAERFDFFNVYANIEEMLNSEKLDGLIIVTPIPLTKKIASSVMGKGVALMIEKTPGENSEQTLELLQIAKKTSTPHTISFNRRFSPAILKAREWINKKLPERRPISISAKMLRINRKEQNFALGTGIHAIDTVLSFAGKPVQICTTKIPVKDSYFYISKLDCDSGISASIILSPFCGVKHKEEIYEIFGTEYYIYIDFIRERLIIYDEGTCVLDWTMPQEADSVHIGSGIGEVENFINFLSGSNEKLEPDLIDGYHAMLISEAIMAGGSKYIS
jgi:predicted dehydrogenase